MPAHQILTLREYIRNRGPLFWLKILIGVFFIAVLVLAAFLIKELFITPREPRTMAELKIMKAQELVKKRPYDVTTHNFLATTYLEVGQDENAEQEFKKAIELAPKNWFAHYGLGNTYVVMKREKDAIKEFSAALKLAPNAPEVYYALGELWIKQKKYDLAIALLETGIKIDPGSADTRYLLAKAYEATGKKNQALAQYNEVLRFVPDFVEAQKAVKRLTSTETPKR